MTLARIIEGLIAAAGIGILGSVIGMAFETVSALLDKDRRAHIKERGIWASARQMLS